MVNSSTDQLIIPCLIYRRARFWRIIIASITVPRMEKLGMSLSSLDHCSIRTAKLDQTRDFYVDVLVMIDGDRPDFPFPGNWRYVDNRAVLHLVGIDPDDPSGLEE